MKRKYGNTFVIGEPLWITMTRGEMGIALTENAEGEKTIRIAIISGQDIEHDTGIIAEWGAKFPVVGIRRLLNELDKE